MKVTKNGIIKGMLLVALILSSTVAWATSTNVYIRPASIFKEPGEEFTIAVEVDNPAGIVAADITLEYDADVLEPVDILPAVEGIQPASLTPLTSPVLNPDDVDPGDGWGLGQNVFPSTIKLALASSSPLSGTGAIVNVRLRVVAGAEDGDISDIFFKQLELNEGGIEALPHGSVVTVTTESVDFVNFSGRITDSLGNGKPNLRVILRTVPPVGAAADFQPENFGDMTDENGDYSISARKDNEYNLSIQRFVNDVPAGLGVIEYGIMIEAEMTEQDYTLYTISGTVTGSGPIPGVKIRSVDQTTMKPLGIGGITDNNGQYTIYVVDGIYTVLAIPPQGSTHIIGQVNDVVVPLGTPGDRTGIDFVLEQGWLLSGTVFGPDGTTPISNVDIRVFNDNALSIPIAWPRTDGQGFYSVALANGQYRLEVSPPPEVEIPTQQEPAAGEPPIEISDADVTYNITLQVENVDFSGFVKADSETGAPVPNAQIMAHPRFPGQGHDTTSGADGSFLIEDMNPGRYDLEVSASGFAFLRLEDVPIKEDITDYPIILQSGVTVTGTVLAPDQTGVPNTCLHFHQTDPWMHAGTVQTNGTGDYEIVLQPGDYHVEIDPPMESGYPSKTDDITVTETDRFFNFELEPGSLLSGRVLIAGGLAGLDDVNLAFEDVSLGHDVAWATSHYDEAGGEHGFYSVILAEGEYNVRAEPPQGIIFTVKIVKGITTPRSEPLDIILDTGVGLSGYVFQSDATGFPDVDVVARSAAPDIPERWTKTGTDGSYSLILAPGSYEVEAIPPSESGYVGQKKHDVDVTGTVTNLNFHLAEGLIVDGIVSDPENQPVPNVNINVHNASPPHDHVAWANTDDGGYYKLTLLSGRYNIIFDPDRDTSPDLIRREIHDREVVSDMPLSVTLKRGVILEGYVTGSGSIEDAWVNAHDPNSGYNNGSNTDAEGKYSIPLRTGTYNVWVDPPSGTAFLPKEIPDVPVPGPDPVRLDIELGTGFAVTGRIVVPDGNNDDLSDNPGMKDVHVSLHPQEPDKHGRDDWTNENGDFSMSVEAGMYTLEYEPPSGSVFVRGKMHDIEVTGDSDLGEILLEVGNTLSGQVFAEDNTPVGGVEIAVRDAFTHEDIAWVWTEPNGHYSVALKDGSYQLEVYPPGMTSFTVNVDVWEDTVKNIKIEERVMLSGVVTKASGGVISGATIVAERITTGELIKSNETDWEGYYEARAPKGTYNLYCLPPDFYGVAAEVVHDVTITSDTTQDFDLESGATVTGKVEDSADKVVVGAKIRFKDTTTGDEYKGVLGAVTNSQGAYTANVPYATYDVTAVPPVGSDLQSKTLPLEVDSFVEALNFTLETETVTPTISVDPTSGKEGDTFTVSGANFQDGETVDIDLGSTSGIADEIVETGGTFSVEVTVDDQEPGIKTVVATGSDSNRTATAQFEIEETAEQGAENPEITDVRASNNLSSSVTITWLTDVPADSTVLYGASEATLDSTVDSAEIGELHRLVLENLTAETTYYYQVQSGQTVHPGAGTAPLQFTTAKEVQPPPSYLIQGKVQKQDGSNAEGALVFATITTKDNKVSHPLSTVVDDKGNWVLNLGNLKNEADGDSITVSGPFELQGTTFYDKIRVEAEGASDGTGSLDASVSGSAPQDLPTIILSLTTQRTVVMKRGFNLMGLPVSTATPVTPRSLLEGIDAAVSVIGWSATTQGYTSAIKKDNGDIVSDPTEFKDEEINPGDGFFLQVSEDVTHTFEGDEISSSIALDLQRGFNLNSIPHPRDTHTPRGLLEGIDAAVSVIGWSATTQGYTSAIKKDNGDIVSDPTEFKDEKIKPTLGDVSVDGIFIQVSAAVTFDPAATVLASPSHLISRSDAKNLTPGVVTKISNVRPSNPTSGSATISWQTDAPAESIVRYGTQKDNLNFVAMAPHSTGYTHSVRLKGLLPETKYYYQVLSDGKTHEFITSKIGLGSGFYLVSGEVYKADGAVVSDDAIVHLTVVRDGVHSYALSTKVESGAWMVNLANLKSTTTGDVFSFSLGDKLHVEVDAGINGTASYTDVIDGSDLVQRLKDIVLTPLSLVNTRKPLVSKLLQNYPNPFNPETWIPYDLAQAAKVTIRIYDVSGSPVRTLNVGNNTAGAYMSKKQAAYWDGNNDRGEAVASGIYFYSIKAGSFTSTKKMVVLK